jgi:hypothetical protein
MAWIEIITLLALVQLLYFSGLVAKARGQYGVKAPAITGHEMFERHYRVQMNTIETLIVFKDPSKRDLGYGLSAIPALALLIAALVGAVRVLMH